ncbi:MAG: sensor histidine kinase, partial [Gemmatimonadetes bacterium]
MSQSARRVALLFGLAAVYYVAAKLGLRFAYINSSVTTIWPPAGIALAAFVLLGYGVWPAIFAGAFFANMTTTGSVFPSVGIAVGNTMEGLLAAYLVNRFARGGRVFDRVRDIIRFTLLAAIVSTALAATVGVAALALGGLVSADDAPRVWLTWWLGDGVGDIVVAPALILWIGVKLGPAWTRRQVVEAVALAVVAALVTLALFGGVFPTRHYPLTVLLWPVMIWVAFRFGPREAATTMLIVSAIAISRTLSGVGPFSVYATNESLVLLQVWTGITAAASLVLAAAVASQRDIQGTWR